MTQVEIERQEELNKSLMDIRAAQEDLAKNRIAKSDYDGFVSKVNAHMDEVDKRIAELAKPSLADVKGALDEGKAQYKSAFVSYLRKGREALSPQEQKVLQVAQDTYAGYLAPEEFVNKIIEIQAQVNPMRSLASVMQTSRWDVQIPYESAIPAASWVAENGSKSETTGLTVGLYEIKPQEMYHLFKATRKMLDDASFNIEAWIASVSARKFGVLEATAMYSGNGTTTGPEGITTNSTVLADAIDVATDNTLVFDDLIKVWYTLESFYAPTATWVMNRSLMGVLMGIKNATTNAYILQPDVQKGFPFQILGRPVVEWADFPAISSTTLSTTPGDGGIVLGLGDFKQGYLIVDRLDMEVQRLNELYAANGVVGFGITKRVGGGVILPAAIQLLKNITS
jgi:HK97 family phage major capsid protein